jgi:glycosyltransferase involved in cell wall biosynthesis
MTPKISILIPLYNHENYILDLLESISKIEFSSFLVLILDDGSTDDSYIRALGCVSQFNYPIKVMHQENHGIVYTLNKLAELAHTKYICFIASDDLFLPKRFNFDLLKMEENKNIVISFGNGVKVINDLETTECLYQDDMLNSLSSGNSLIVYNYITSTVPAFYLQGCTCRKDFFIEIGGFDKGLIADDWAFNIKVFKKLSLGQYQYYFHPMPIFGYREHRKNVHKNIERQFRLISEIINFYIPEKNKKYFESIYSSYLYYSYREKNWDLVKEIIKEKGILQVFKMIIYYIKKYLHIFYQKFSLTKK